MAVERGIPRPEVQPWMHPEVRQVRGGAATHLQELMSSLPSLRGARPEQTTLLGGGIISACYLVETDNGSRVVKFSPWRSPSEGEALGAWKKEGAKVPSVYDYGQVPSTAESKLPVNFTVMDAIINAPGVPAQTADKLVKNPEKAWTVGQLMGVELAKMHAAPVPEKPYGSQSPIDEFNTTGETWNDFLKNEIAKYQHHLIRLGFTNQDIANLHSKIATLNFGNKRSYIHNDPSLRNVLIYATELPDIVSIDPNPIVGDKHWEFAYLADKAESTKRKSAKKPDSEKHRVAYEIHGTYASSVIQAYEIETGERLDATLLLACQLPRALKRMDWFAGRAEQFLGAEEGALETAVTSEIVTDQVNQLLAA